LNLVKEVEYMDQRIGEIIGLFKKKGLLDNTVLVLTSDHGEGLGDHDQIGHITQLYNSIDPTIINLYGEYSHLELFESGFTSKNYTLKILLIFKTLKTLFRCHLLGKLFAFSCSLSYNIPFY